MAEREQAEAIRTAVEQEIANWHEREIKRIQDHWEEHKPKYVAAGGDAVRHIADLVKWHRSAATAISSGAYRKPAQGDAR